MHRHANLPAPNVRHEFGRDADAPRGARSALRSLFDDPDDPIADAVTLAASELVSNVVRHTGDGGTMQAWDPKPQVPLRLQVDDRDPTMPERLAAPGAELGGRGLSIVETLADNWGVDRTVGGKAVWAEFSRPGPAV